MLIFGVINRKARSKKKGHKIYFRNKAEVYKELIFFKGEQLQNGKDILFVINQIKVKKK